VFIVNVITPKVAVRSIQFSPQGASHHVVTFSRDVFRLCRLLKTYQRLILSSLLLFPKIK
jgi:hypothetical protein